MILPTTSISHSMRLPTGEALGAGGRTPIEDGAAAVVAAAVADPIDAEGRLG